MKKFVALALASVMVLSLAACGDSSSSTSSTTTDASSATTTEASGDTVEIEDSYTWNVAMNVSETTLNYKFYDTFKSLIEAKSGNKITVNLYANGQLGGDAEQLQGLMDGTIQFSTTITSGMTSTIPAYGLFDLPNAFDDVTAMREVEDNADLVQALNDASAEKGIYLMGLADAGFRELTTNVEVKSVDDLKGMKIRVIDNPYHQAYWTSLGAATTTMDFNEVYSSLQQKVIDAEENPYMNICANSFYEVQDYIVETNHLGHIMIFTMNKALYDSLPENVQTLINECAAEALTTTRDAADEAIEGYKKTIEESGTTILTLDDATLEEMRTLSAGVYDQVRADLGDDLVDTFTAACEAANNQ